jgi:hypothetical protein
LKAIRRNNQLDFHTQVSRSFRIGNSLLIIVALAASVDCGAAAECTRTSAPIETDRPDVTNSSVVVPVGSFQQENGINLSRSNNGVAFDGSNTRLRVGVTPCLEVLVDLPTYVTGFGRGVAAGFTNVVPAVKWQISPIPEKFDLSRSADTQSVDSCDRTAVQ